MKHLFLLLIVLVCQQAAKTQVTSLSDSLQLLLRGAASSSSTGNSTGKGSSAVSLGIYTSLPESNRLQEVLSNASQLAADSIHQAGILLASYRNTHGGLHTAQQPYNSHEAELYTEGLSTLGNTKIAGSFRAGRLWQDSMANYLAGYPDDISPYYYFTVKAGSYQGQRYTMRFVLSHAIVPNKLYLGLGADYDYRWVTRSVDPRPDDKKMFLNIHPSVSLRVGKTMLGMEYTGGYERGTISILYQNTMYNLSTLYPERFYYLNMGYGNIALKYNIVNKRKGSTNGIALHLASQVDGYDLKADAGYSREEEQNLKNLDTSTLSTFFSRWTVDHYQGTILLMQRRASAIQQFLLQVQLQHGADFNSLYNASNYFARQNRYSLQYYYYGQGNHRIQPLYRISVNYSDEYKRDILAAHYVQYQWLQPGIAAGIQRNWKASGDVLTITAAPSLLLPLTAVWTVPATQENVFTTAIVYPDFYYHSTTILQTELHAQYTTNQLLKTMPAGFSLTASWQQSLSVKEGVMPPVANQLGSNRLSLQLSFQLFL